MDRIEKERQKEVVRIQAEHMKVAKMPAKSPRRTTSTLKKMIGRSRRTRKGLWIMIQNLDEARADELNRGREAKS